MLNNTVSELIYSSGSRGSMAPSVALEVVLTLLIGVAIPALYWCDGNIFRSRVWARQSRRPLFQHRLLSSLLSISSPSSSFPSPTSSPEVVVMVVPYNKEQRKLFIVHPSGNECGCDGTLYFPTFRVAWQSGDAVFSDRVKAAWVEFCDYDKIGKDMHELDLVQVVSVTPEEILIVYTPKQVSLEEAWLRESMLKGVPEEDLWELAVAAKKQDEINCQKTSSSNSSSISSLSPYAARFLREYYPVGENMEIRRKDVHLLDDILKYNSGKLWQLQDYSQLDPCNYLFSASSGKAIRSSTVHQLSKCFDIAPRDLASLQWCIEHFHGLSLLIDDVEDASETRRGKRCAHLVFGLPLTLNAAYFSVFRLIDAVPLLFSRYHEATQQLILRACVDIHRGQGLDIAWRERRYCPTEAEYVDMVRCKTSSPFVLSGRLFFLHSNDWRVRADRYWTRVRDWVVGCFRSILPSSILSTATIFSMEWGRGDTEERTVELLDKIGIFFQVRDDYINLTDPEYWKSKGFCDDIHERKFSFPIIRMIELRQGRYRELLELYGQPEPLSRAQIEEGLEMIKETDALEYTRNKCIQLRSEILEHLKREDLQQLRKPLESLSIK